MSGEVYVRPARREDWTRMVELDRELAVFEKSGQLGVVTRVE